MPNVRILSKSQVADLVSLKKAIEVVEDAFTAYQEGQTLIPPVVNLDIEKCHGEVHIKTAFIESMDTFAVKMASGFYDNPKIYGLPTGSGILVLSSGKTGRPLAIMDSAYITFLRTGASGALGIKYLAPTQVDRAAIIGAGINARWQLRGLMHFRAVREVRVFDIVRDSAAKFALEMSSELGLPISVAETASQAVEKVQVIVTCTPSRAPIIMKDWVRPGTHINAIGADMKGKQELDERLFETAKVVVDHIGQGPVFGECEMAVLHGILDVKRIYAEIGQLTSGKKPGRTSAEEVTIYDATGVAIQDVAVATLAYVYAERQNIGHVIEV